VISALGIDPGRIRLTRRLEVQFLEVDCRRIQFSLNHESATCKLALSSRNALHFSKLAQNPSARSLPKNPIEVEVETAGFRLPTIRQPPCPQRVVFGQLSGNPTQYPASGAGSPAQSSFQNGNPQKIKRRCRFRSLSFDVSTEVWGYL
jgi:hypothetical protein